jgi:cyclase
MTEAEELLWRRLNKNQLKVRFKPQHPIDVFVADFYCHELKLIIEVDGEIHNDQKEKDESRSIDLQNHGIKIIRFTNDEVYHEIEKVVNKIESCIKAIQDLKHNLIT